MIQQTRSTFVITDPSEIVRALVGLKDVRVLAYTRRGPDVELVIEQVLTSVRCPACGGSAQVKERPVVRYVDLPVYGTPMRLSWKKHRMRCPSSACPKRSWVLQDHRIAAKNCLLTTRAAKWATVQVGGGRTVSEVAGELACDWHTVNDAVTTYGEALLEADRKRLNRTTAIGLDETSFTRLGSRGYRDYATTVADVENHQIIDILPSREFTDVAGWIDKQPEAWKERIRFGALDMSNTYAAVFSVMLPRAQQVVDSFHAVALANRCLDDIRRRVQFQQLGHRGRRDDPLYRVRRALLMGEEKLNAEATARLSSLLELGDPHAEVAIAYRIKERLRDFYRASDPDEARQMLQELERHCLKRAMPPEIQRLGRTIRRWFEKLCNYHLAKVSNGPTEALNNLVKRIKRIGFGFRNFRNYRIRALLYAGKPNWRVLGSIVVR
ncbi:MAG: ISL3 family transposase [Chloroflexota bacterium]|nr:ISL3 family transposase [Chloroflexota bacterium]